MEATNVQVMPANAQPCPDLQNLTTREIRAKYQEVFGVPTHSNNRGYLLRRLAERTLAPATETLPQGAEPTTEQPERGPVPVSPEVEQNSQEHTTPAEPATPARDPRLPPPGSFLSRVYKGQEHRVTVLENGFEYEGEIYTSLSKIAKLAAGCCWNGFSFFMLGPRK